MGIDEFLGSSEETPAPEPTEESQDAVPEPPGEDADVPEPQDEDEPKADAGSDERVVPLPALKEERRKRQEADRKIEELERRIAYAQQQAQPQAPAPEPIDPYSDLPGALQAVERGLRYRMSEDMARDRYTDYDEVMADYADAIRENPALAYAVESSGAPSITAYRALQQRREAKKLADPTAMKKKIEEEVSRRVKEELEARGLSKAASIPPSISTARGSGANRAKGDAWAGPPSLKEILAAGKRR